MRMDAMNYYLMHRDDPIAVVSIDSVTGAMLKVSQQTVAELLPLGGAIDADMLRKWWQRRAVPVRQGNMAHILERLGMATPQSYLVQNLALSLSDHYWIKPVNSDIGWQDVNLFINAFRDPVGQMQMAVPDNVNADTPIVSFSPSSSVQGELRKKWIISDGTRFLVKGNHGANSQESVNEVVATLLHQKQQKQPFTTYTLVKETDNSQYCCMCESFTSDRVEFVPAIDIVESEKRPNNLSVYEHFVAVCEKHGLSQKIVRPFMEYQIITDYVLTNIDRHLNNFGVLRDTHTLRFVGMAPIFDSGNAMFWKNPKLPEYDDLNEIGVTSFRSTENKLLELVTDRSIVDIAKLPTTEELQALYEKDPLIPCVDSILFGYQKKIALLEKWI